MNRILNPIVIHGSLSTIAKMYQKKSSSHAFKGEDLDVHGNDTAASGASHLVTCGCLWCAIH